MLSLSRICYLTRILKSPMLKLRNIRHSSDEVWVYRTSPPPAPRHVNFIADSVGAIMWYWILWHLVYDYEHLIGHFAYPERLKYTDEELGIPPDNEDV